MVEEVEDWQWCQGCCAIVKCSKRDGVWTCNTCGIAQVERAELVKELLQTAFDAEDVAMLRIWLTGRKSS